MDRNAKSLRRVMGTFNVLFSFCGLLYITVGSFMISVIREFEITGNVRIVPYTSVFLGCAMFFLSLQSCYGLYREKSGVLTMYSASNLLLCLIHVYFVSYLWMELGTKMYMSSDSYPKYPGICYSVPNFDTVTDLSQCRDAILYSWNMGCNIIQFTSVVLIVLEFFIFAIGCYVADAVRVAERSQYTQIA